LNLPGWLGAALVYGLLGLSVALLLRHQGQPTATAIGAVVAWPLLVSLLNPTKTTPTAPPRGPLADSIDAAFARTADVLALDLPDGQWLADLDAVRLSLQRVDARLALVDRILAEEADERDLGRLRAARARSADEVEGVLSGVGQLRVQVGLLALSDVSDNVPSTVFERLSALRGRARALEELSSPGDGAPAPDSAAVVRFL
jgi:hypothetical protein